MSYPLPANPENVGIMIATGLVGDPPPLATFSAPLRFTAGAAADTAIATLSNPISGETLALAPADGRVRWDGNVLEVGGTATPTATTLYYTVTRTKNGVSFSQTITISAV